MKEKYVILSINKTRNEINASDLVAMAIYLTVLYAYLPIIKILPYFGRIIVGGMPFVLTCLAVVLQPTAKNVYRLSGVIVFSFFLAIVRIYSNANQVTPELSIFELGLTSTLYWLPLFEGKFVLDQFSSKQINNILKFSLSLLFFSIITTIIGNISYRGISRSSIELSKSYYLLNIGNYSFIYGVASCVPIFLYLNVYIHKQGTTIYKRKLINEVLCFFLLLIFFLFAQFMTAFAIGMGAFVFLFLANSKKWKKIILVFILLLFILFIPHIVELFASMFEELGLHSLWERLHGISLFLEGQLMSGDAYARLNLYKASLIHFSRNPLFGLIGEKGFIRIHPTPYSIIMEGNTGYSVGRHSDLLDLLGGGGIFGFLPLFVVYIDYILYILRKSKSYMMRNLIFVVFSLNIVYGLTDHFFSSFETSLAVFLLLSLVIKQDYLTSKKNEHYLRIGV